MEDIIAAIATGPSRGAIGILRLSGPGAAQCVARLFRPASGKDFASGVPGKLTLGTLYDRQGRVLDQAMATFSVAPNSYTGEDTAELHCHGSPTVLNLALEALFSVGVRQAGPGEFTKRAFLNGKLDLVQAEAVIDLIDSQTPAAARAAASQLEGALSKKLEAIYDDLVNLLAHFQAAVDYPDEDIEPFEQEEMETALAKAKGELKALLKSYERGKCLNQGLPCAIVGEPNAGKSSLLNALLGYDRAIVTDIPGTTRDTVEERCNFGGVPLRLTDTAGLRQTRDQVEKMGVERSEKAMESAGLIFVVADGTWSPDEALQKLVNRACSIAPTVLVWNKADRPGYVSFAPGTTPVTPDFPPCAPLDLPDQTRAIPPVCPGSPPGSSGVSPRFFGEKAGSEPGQDPRFTPETPAKMGTFPPFFAVSVSAKTGEGLDELEEIVSKILKTEENGDVLLTNPRQAQQAREALEALENAETALAQGFDFDAPLLDVENALAAMGGLTGREVQNDVISRVFERFCVGK